jgi:hypothetical protein
MLDDAFCACGAKADVAVKRPPANTPLTIATRSETTVMPAIKRLSASITLASPTKLISDSRGAGSVLIE